MLNPYKLKTGDVITYGYNDPKNSIECVFYDTFIKNGELIILAKCAGGEIQAPADMFI